MIPRDKILAVLGTPRSGTSIAMRMLDALEVQIAGEREPQAEQNDGSNRAALIASAARELNPDGFFEVPGIVGRGMFSRRIMDGLKLGGKAVKLVGGAMLPVDGVTPRGTDYAMVDRAILCLRDPREVAVSQQGLVSGVLKAGDGNWTAKIPHALSPATYIRDMGRLCMAMADGWPVKMLVIDYAAWSDPQRRADQAAALAGFVGSDRPERAAGLWKDQLHRSRMEAWPDKLAVDGELADAIYAAMLDGDYSVVVPMVAAYAAREQLERVQWFDARTRQMVNPGVWRMMTANQRGCRDKMTHNADQREAAGVQSTSCPHWARSRERIQIEVPADLSGDGIAATLAGGKAVSLPLVACGFDGDVKPDQVCQRCWTHGIARADEATSAPMMNQAKGAKQ